MTGLSDGNQERLLDDQHVGGNSAAESLVALDDDLHESQLLEETSEQKLEDQSQSYQMNDDSVTLSQACQTSFELVSRHEISDQMEVEEAQPTKQMRAWRRLFRLRPKVGLGVALGACRPSFTIMISYQHAEAQKYAVRLKRALVRLGLSTYLDIDEIASGSDWQDQLNAAVLNCAVLVCLVTPSYGETLWTARELKLADSAGKQILPVNFSQTWPPPSLAIQLASRQFIAAWLSPASLRVRQFHAGQRGPKWTEADARRVAGQVAGALTSSRSPSSGSYLDESTPLCNGSDQPQRYAAFEQSFGHSPLADDGRRRRKQAVYDSDASSSACSSLSSCHFHAPESPFATSLSQETMPWPESRPQRGLATRLSLSGRAAKLLKKMRRKASVSH